MVRVMIMFNKNNWKEPIYKNDVIGVLVNGLIAAILGGILGGSIDYLLNVVWGFPLSFSVLIVMFFIIWRVRKGFYSYHILYPVLSLVFLIIGIFFVEYTVISIGYMTIGNYNIHTILITPLFWEQFLMSPIYTLRFGIMYGSAKDIIFGILDIIFYIWAFWYVYRMVKGRN